MRVPLHLPPDDYSPRACLARLRHGIAMGQLNPRGFRKARTGRHKKRINHAVTRIDFLHDMVRIGRGADIMANLQRAKFKRVDV